MVIKNLSKFKEDVMNIQLSNGYLLAGHNLIRFFDIDTTIFLNDLINKYDYYYINNGLINDTFSASVDDIKFNTGLSKYKQKTIIEELEAYNLINIVVNNQGKARVFKLNKENISNFIRLLNYVYKEMDEGNNLDIKKNLLDKYNISIDKIKEEKLLKRFNEYKDVLKTYMGRKEEANEMNNVNSPVHTEIDLKSSLEDNLSIKKILNKLKNNYNIGDINEIPEEVLKYYGSLDINRVIKIAYENYIYHIPHRVYLKREKSNQHYEEAVELE